MQFETLQKAMIAAMKAREKERKEAHIREVTSMDLPLDWENVFDQDVRTQGVHADSISDGLMYSLSDLGRVDIEYISSITGAITIIKIRDNGLLPFMVLK